MASTTHNARSRRTRDALLTAGRELLEERGFAPLTMAAVAERAGVSRRAVYLHFQSRTALVAEIYEHTAEQEGRTESLRRVWAQTDPVLALDEWAAHLARYHTKVLAIDRAVRTARFVDPDAAAYRAEGIARQRANCRMLIQGLSDAGRLADGWTVDTGADMLWSLLSTDMMDGLLTECGWDTAVLSDRLRLLYRSAFVTA
ncbi:TetR family transcriptional regulator [Stackebrandtia albiflava]|uniref:TetR family transcriptional regulator n=1 Tax=Stackebrandtia albiflava TaxID=406432 RepID=A0A562URI5_9ACTN|nr:TetR/AcrR family transcriptional regulator [Stackebrandtia albiflava]TWJ08235.1 TetR family transcriptional regulator [Stackebrandtia albiflava]